MSVKLRLRRIGRKKIPAFSIVAADSRKARDGRYIEDIGRYYPLREPAEVQLDEDRALYWLENGAQPSDTVRSILHRRGLLLHHHLMKKGEAPDEIEQAVEEFRSRMADQEELKIVVETEGKDPLEKERERAEEIDEEARLRAQATPLSVVTEEAEKQEDTAEEETEGEEEAEGDEEPDADDAEAEGGEDLAEDDADEDASDEPEASDDEEDEDAK